MGTPKLITTAARAAPRGPKVRMSDIPSGSVHHPGDPGYHGTGWQHGGRTWKGKGTDDKRRSEWGRRAGYENARADRDARWHNDDLFTGRVTYGTGAGLAAGGALTGAGLYAVSSHRARRVKAGRHDSRLVRKTWEKSMPFVRQATKHRGVYDVSSMPRKPSRENRFARWAATDNGTQALLYGGLSAGIGTMAVGAARGQDKVQRASRNRRAKLRRSQLRVQGNAVGKSLYQREEHLVPLHAAGAVAAGTLGVYGVGHSQMIGRQITRGIKLAEYDGNQRAADALRRAQAARGSIRAGMAPGEAAVRRLRAVDHAIELVPKRIRGEVAIAAGMLLGSHSRPVHQQSYQRAW